MLMEITITKEDPDWSEISHGKRIVAVTFPNCKFKWLPTYRQIAQIMVALEEIENESWKSK